MAYTNGSDSHGGMVDVMVGGCNGDVDGEGTELYDRVSRSVVRGRVVMYIFDGVFFFYVNKTFVSPRWSKVDSSGRVSLCSPLPSFPQRSRWRRIGVRTITLSRHWDFTGTHHHVSRRASSRA